MFGFVVGPDYYVLLQHAPLTQNKIDTKIYEEPDDPYTRVAPFDELRK